MLTYPPRTYKTSKRWRAYSQLEELARLISRILMDEIYEMDFNYKRLNDRTYNLSQLVATTLQLYDSTTQAPKNDCNCTK